MIGDAKVYLLWFKVLAQSYKILFRAIVVSDPFLDYLTQADLAIINHHPLKIFCICIPFLCSCCIYCGDESVCVVLSLAAD